MQIRLAGIADLEGLREIENRAILETAANFHIEPVPAEKLLESCWRSTSASCRGCSANSARARLRQSGNRSSRSS